MKINKYSDLKITTSSNGKQCSVPLQVLQGSQDYSTVLIVGYFQIIMYIKNVDELLIFN